MARSRRVVVACVVEFALRAAAKRRPPMAPMCEPDGTCHESADAPSPRTVYTAKNAEQKTLWWSWHERLAKTSAAFAPSKRPLLLLGDSITESWLGSSYGEPEKGRAAGVPAVLEQKFSGFSPLVLAISGDQTQHLLYRFGPGGELPRGLEKDAVGVLLIGTNNLGRGHLPNETARGVVAVVDIVRRHVKRLVVVELLPRDDYWVLPRLCPPRCDRRGRPFPSFAPAIAKTNAFVRAALSSREGVVVVDCAAPFLDARGEVRQDRMPDRLHPNANGMGLLADCVLEHL